MDTASADPDTQTDVNLLILDYLLCLAIEAVLSKRISEREGHQSQWDAGWLVNSVNSKLPACLQGPGGMRARLTE